MIRSIIDFFGNKEFLDNYLVELSGIFTELLLLSILLPIFLWIYNYKKNRVIKYESLLSTFHFCNRVFDVYGRVLGIVDEKNNSSFYNYFSSNSSELRVGFFNSYIYGTLISKLFCVEHYIRKNSSFQIQENNIEECILELENIQSSFERYLIHDLRNKKLVEQINVLKLTFQASSDLLKETKRTKEQDLINAILNSMYTATILSLTIFYNNVRFVERYYDMQMISRELYIRKYKASSREQIIKKFYNMEEKRLDRGYFTSQLFELIRAIKRI